MPTKEAAELQHSREFVEEQDAAVMRQTPVAKGDFHISRRSTHPDLNLTKSDVKVTMKICSGSPARSVRNSHPMPFFTPDSGDRAPKQSLSAESAPACLGRRPCSFSEGRQCRPDHPSSIVRCWHHRSGRGPPSRFSSIRDPPPSRTHPPTRTESGTHAGCPEPPAPPPSETGPGCG